MVVVSGFHLRFKSCGWFIPLKRISLVKKAFIDGRGDHIRSFIGGMAFVLIGFH
jgi:hypothetical protein